MIVTRSPEETPYLDFPKSSWLSFARKDQSQKAVRVPTLPVVTTVRPVIGFRKLKLAGCFKNTEGCVKPLQ
jgi:hypothetical protein